MTKSTALKLASNSPAPAPQTTLSHDVLVSAAAQIVSAYIVNRPHEAIELTKLTADVYHTLASLSQEQARGLSADDTSPRAPSVSVEASVQADYLVCLEDGKQVKMLKRYLKSNYNMTPEQYRARWDLPTSYPMVAPNYAKVRSNLAKQIGLGRRGMPSVAKRMGDSRIALR